MAFPHDGIKFKKGVDGRRVGNPKGRPRKSFEQICDYLEDAGVPPLTHDQLLRTYKLVFNATEQQLKDIAGDSAVPYALKIIILELNDKKGRIKAIQDLRDYVFGRATENKNVNVSVEQPLFSWEELKTIDIKHKEIE